MHTNFKKPVFIFIGLPGSGKDTQAQLLAKKLNLPHIDVGGIFTQIVREKGEHWEQIANTYKYGPVSSELFIEIIGKRFEADDCQNGFILSQNTKSVNEVNLMFRLFRELGFEVFKVFYLRVSAEVAIERCIKRLNGKFTEKEPSEEALVLRIQNYAKIIEDIVSFYKSKELLIELDGEKSIEEVFPKIMSELTV